MRRGTFRPRGGDSVAVMAGEDRHDASCFADEVAIDFPSVDLALARIRRAFLADERPTQAVHDRLRPDGGPRTGAMSRSAISCARTCPLRRRDESWTGRAVGVRPTAPSWSISRSR